MQSGSYDGSPRDYYFQGVSAHIVMERLSPPPVSIILEGSAMILYRPVGLHELRLVYESGMREFPPRLPEQPIFYPVLNASYAGKIARDWNTVSNALAGYVTAFDVRDEYCGTFQRRVVGAALHGELWVPAEELPTFNENIIEPIHVIAAYFGTGFRGMIAEHGQMNGADADGQMALLGRLCREDRAAFAREIQSNHIPLFLHYPYWAAMPRGRAGQDAEDLMAALRAVWSGLRFPPLPGLGI